MWWENVIRKPFTHTFKKIQNCTDTYLVSIQIIKYSLLPEKLNLIISVIIGNNYLNEIQYGLFVTNKAIENGDESYKYPATWYMYVGKS